MITPHAKVMVAGAGVAGAGCVQLLQAIKCNVQVADDNETARQRLAEATGVRNCSTSTALRRIAELDALVVSPGWRPDNPLVAAALAAEVPVLGDVELAWQVDQSGLLGKPRNWVCITGTNGKTTTTAMTAAILQQAGHNAVAVGNIGDPVTAALLVTPRVDVLVVECSSFQLHWSSTLTPEVGCVLNIAPDHLDWHGSFAAYADAKMKLAAAHNLVLGLDDPVLAAWAENNHHDRLLAFVDHEPAEGQFGVSTECVPGDAVIAWHDQFGLLPLSRTAELSPPGAAGRLDALAATAITAHLGIKAEDIIAGLKNFEVAAHRGQVVASARGVLFIDNSKATNPHAADIALRGVTNIIWIAGGQLKDAEVGELVATHAPRIKQAILLGQDREVIAQETRAKGIPTTVIDTQNPQAAMTQAVAAACSTATAGDTVLLAPAAASLDMFSGMGQRGDMFAAAAAKLWGRGSTDE